MLTPAQFMPSEAEDLLLIDPEDLALPLLRFMDAIERQHGSGRLLLHNLTLPERDSRFGSYAGPLHVDVLKHIRETWGVIDRHGWLVEDSRHGPTQGWKTISAAGHRALEAEDPHSWASATMLPQDMDPQLKQRVVSRFIRGEWSDAVRDALRTIEVRIRERTSLTSRGRRDLMRDAFRAPDVTRGIHAGPLHDATPGRAGAEEALRFVFEGVMGAWLNDHTHEDLAVDTAGEAAELIHLANLLLRLVESRSP